LKCSIIFWAFDPEPEAKIAILFFIDIIVSAAIGFYS